MTEEDATADLKAAGAERVEFGFDFEHAKGIAVFRGKRASAVRVTKRMTPDEVRFAAITLKQWLRKQG